MAEIITLSNYPDSNDLWKGIGGHFDSFSQILCEFIDNSISNFIKNNLLSKSIIITIKEKNNQTVFVSIEDSGTGIKNLDIAFALGNKSGGETPLNEHGFGMKHALATANPSNDSWKVLSRTKDEFQKQLFKKVESPYKINGYEAHLLTTSEENWAGELNGSGTYVEFVCNLDFFYSLRRGINGRLNNFEKLLDILSEDLGFIYSGLIQENKATITIQGEDKENNQFQKTVKSVTPNWKQFYNPGQGNTTIDLGGGNVNLKYSFGAMNTSNYSKYYKKSMSSSGLEIRINGRLLGHNLFKEVWGIERHNMYNHLLVIVDIISDKKNALPVTRTSKNGIREGDGKFEKLLEWVRQTMPDPLKELEGAYDESDLFDQLEKQKQIHVPDPKTVTREQNVYKGISEKIPLDLYIHYQNKVEIYEGKKRPHICKRCLST